MSDKAEECLFFLDELINAEDIDSDFINAYCETEEGLEGFCTLKIQDIAQQAASFIEQQASQIAELTKANNKLKAEAVREMLGRYIPEGTTRKCVELMKINAADVLRYADKLEQESEG